MNVTSLLQIGLFLAALLLLAKPLGWYMARVYEAKPCGLGWALGWLERLIYRICGIDPKEEMAWTTYAKAMLLVQSARFRRRLPPATDAASAAAESAEHAARAAGPGHEHGRQLRHEHELAKLRRRNAR